MKRDIAFLVLGGVSLLFSFFGTFPVDSAWLAILLCGIPILKEAAVGLVTRFDIKADVLVSLALIASVAIGEIFAAGEIAFIMQLGSLLEELLDATFVRLPDDYFSNLTHYLEIGGIHLGKIRRKLYVSDSAAILALLRQTDVIRFGPALSAPDFAEYGIHSIPVRNSGVEISVGWLQRKRELLTPEAEEFVGLLKGLFPSPGAADPEPHPL